jgi:dihydroorotate dehydrogenase electron transfer subunit
MQLEYRKARVFENTQISNGIFKLVVEKSNGEKPVPGQFMMLRTATLEPFLSRPISIHDADGEKLYFVFEIRGEGTKSLSRLQKNDEVEILGPLGNGFGIENIKGKIAVISGGMGIAPMNYLIKSLRNCEIDLYAGFRNTVYGIDGISEFVNNVYITTEDGSTGIKGYVTEIFNSLEYNAVLCCGPEMMMKKIVETCKTQAVPVYISMEKHMACGVGACLVCSCKTSEGNKRTCKDGPVFSGRDVILDA